jgi:hypothetical protein
MLIDDEDLIIADNIIFVTLKETLCLECIFYVVKIIIRCGSIDIIDPENFLYTFDSFF